MSNSVFGDWVKCRPNQETCYAGVVWTEAEQTWMITSGITYLAFDFLIAMGPVVMGAVFYGPMAAAFNASSNSFAKALGGFISWLGWAAGGWNFLLYGAPMILGFLQFAWPDNMQMAMLYEDWTYWGIHVTGLTLNILFLGFNAILAIIGTAFYPGVWTVFITNLVIMIAGYIMYFICWEAMVAFYNSGYFAEWLGYSSNDVADATAM